MGKYVIVYDTNILFMGSKENNYNTFDFSSSLKNIINIISDNNLGDNRDCVVGNKATKKRKN